MKKKSVFLLILVLLLSACSKGSVEPTPIPEEPKEEQIIEQEIEQEDEQEVEQEADTSDEAQAQEQQDDPIDPMDMAQTVLNDPMVIFQEDAAMMDENTAANFGSVAIKQLGEGGEYYQFISNIDGAYMIGNMNFLDVGDFRGNAQAVMIKFQPENVEGLFFTLFGNGEIILSFPDNQPFFTHVNDNYNAPYSDYRDTNLTLESDKWYWAIMAMDAEGNFRSLVWEEQNPENNAYCGENMGDWHPEYKGGNWHLTIGFGPNQTLNIKEYFIMDFDGFTDMEYSGGGES